MYVRLPLSLRNAEELFERVINLRHEGEMLESYLANTRQKAAALTFEKALKRHGSPEAIPTDDLRSYGAAMAKSGCREKQEIDTFLVRLQPPAFC